MYATPRPASSQPKLLDRCIHWQVFSSQIQDFASLPVVWPFEIADLNCKRQSDGEGMSVFSFLHDTQICVFCSAIEPDSKAQYYLVMLALIVVVQLEQDEARVQR
jgi:hypothetical protein